MMSGDNELETDSPSPKDQQLARVETLWADYLKRQGVIALEPCPEVAEFMNANGQMLTHMSFEKLSYGTILLARYAGYLQQEYNKHKARAEWAETQLRRTIGDALIRQTAFHYEERKILAIRQTPRAIALEDIKIHASGLATQLADLAFKVQTLIKTYSDYRELKRK